MKIETCTSMMCNNYDCDYCSKCSHAVFFGDGLDTNGKKWQWTFNPRFGPLFLRQDRTEMQRQPRQASKAWEVFEIWHNNKILAGGIKDGKR